MFRILLQIWTLQVFSLVFYFRISFKYKSDKWSTNEKYMMNVVERSEQPWALVTRVISVIAWAGIANFVNLCYQVFIFWLRTTKWERNQYYSVLRLYSFYSYLNLKSELINNFLLFSLQWTMKIINIRVLTEIWTIMNYFFSHTFVSLCYEVL